MASSGTWLQVFFSSQMDSEVYRDLQVHLNKLEYRGKVHLFQ